MTRPSPLIPSFDHCADYFMRSLSSACLDFEGATAYVTGVDAAHLNPLSLRAPGPSLARTLQAAQTFYATHNAPWLVLVAADQTSEAVATTLNTFGLHLEETTTTMVLDLKKAPIPPHLEAGVLPTDHHLETWIAPLNEAFEGTLEIGRQYTEAHARALARGAAFYHWSLVENHQAIASLTLTLHQTAAMINDVGTRPAFQRHGYATRLMHHALAEAARLGATQCFLEASSSGLALYEKLGFTRLFLNNIYAFPNA